MDLMIELAANGPQLAGETKMSKNNGTSKVAEMVELVEEEQANVLLTNFRKLLLAGFGAASITQETIDKLQDEVVTTFDKLVERGEKVETDTRKRVTEKVNQRKKQVQEKEVTFSLFGYGLKVHPGSRPQLVTPEGKADMDARIEEMMGKLNLPTQQDVKALTTKLNTLNRKVDELRKQQEMPAKTET